MEQFDFLLDGPDEIAVEIAKQIKNIRKRKKITQKQMAARANVSYASYRKFEETGMISLFSFIKVMMELGMVIDLKAVFEKPSYRSIEEVINENK